MPTAILPFSRDLDKLAATCRVKQNRKKKNSKRETPIAVECLTARGGSGQPARGSWPAPDLQSLTLSQQWSPFSSAINRRDVPAFFNCAGACVFGIVNILDRRLPPLTGVTFSTRTMPEY